MVLSILFLLLTTVTTSNAATNSADCAKSFAQVDALSDVIAARTKVGADVSVPHPSELDPETATKYINARIVQRSVGGVQFTYLSDAGKIERGYLAEDEFVFIRDVRAGEPLGVMTPELFRAQALKRVKEAERQAALKKYAPVGDDMEITQAQVDTSREALQKQLEKQGVRVRPAKFTSYIGASTEVVNGEKVKAPIANAFLEVVELPKPLRHGDGFTNVFVHPGMAKRMKEAEAMGIRVVTDATIPFSGAEAYYSHYQRILVLDPNTPWHVLEHEFQHIHFSHFLDAARLAPVKTTKSGYPQFPNEVVKLLGRAKVKHAIALEKRGIPVRAIDETIAVGNQLVALGYKRFVPGTREMDMANKANQYAVRHQIHEILLLENPTTRQLAELENLKVRLARLEDKGSAPASDTAKFAVGAAGASALGLGTYRFKEYFYSEEKKEVYALTNEGEWVHYRGAL